MMSLIGQQMDRFIYFDDLLNTVKSGHASTTIDLSCLWCLKLEKNSWGNEKAQASNQPMAMKLSASCWKLSWA